VSSAAYPAACWLTPPIGASDADRERIAPLIAAAESAGAACLLDAVAWGLFPGWTVAVAQGGRTHRLDADAVVLATGRAVARPVFPGHQLPGVTTPLGLLRALEEGEAREGQRLALLGDGPLARAVRELAEEHGLELVALLGERDTPDDPHAIRLRTPPRAGGAGRLERLDVETERGRRTLLVDWLCVTEPESGAIELAGMAGVDLRFAGFTEGFRPVSGPDGATAAPGLFVAGSLVGSAALDAALASGHAAGLAVAARAGRVSALAAEEAYVPQPPAPPRLVSVLLREPPHDDTVACHCTGHSVADVRAAIAAGARSLDDVKRQSKVGMGLCQGRDCARLVARLLELEGGVDVASLRAMRPRPPARPLTARQMFEEEVSA
jgi:D-hydroxyproline dehydrogenase subunit alpha